MASTRRDFLRTAGVAAAGLTLGPRFLAMGAPKPRPFGPLQDDPLLKLPEGFHYQVVAETGLPLLDGPRKFTRPQFPDLNVVFPQGNDTVVLSTSHELPGEFPLPVPAPGEEYDRVTGGAITSLHLGLTRDVLTDELSLDVKGGSYNAGGMLANCSGSGTPWGTVLTGEESQASFEQPHGFVWEVDVQNHTKTRLDGLGVFDHETAVVDPRTGIVYGTEDSSPGYLYRFVPVTKPSGLGDLTGPGSLQALTVAPDGTAGWVAVDDPFQAPAEAGTKGAHGFSRLEGGAFDPLDPEMFYFTETEDPSGCGRVWRLDVGTPSATDPDPAPRLELFSQGHDTGIMCMPDNLAFDPAGNLFVCEDRGDAGPGNPNHVIFLDRDGNAQVFAELVQYWQTPDPPANVADEVTGPAFWHGPNGVSVLFLNIQRAMPTFGMTLAIFGPFPGTKPSAGRRIRRPALL
jgi:hypothetical protein